jgi:hypothetical protein
MNGKNASIQYQGGEKFWYLQVVQMLPGQVEPSPCFSCSAPKNKKRSLAAPKSATRMNQGIRAGLAEAHLKFDTDINLCNDGLM